MKSEEYCGFHKMVRRLCSRFVNCSFSLSRAKRKFQSNLDFSFHAGLCASNSFVQSVSWQYTSVLPPEAVEVPLQNAERTFMHGEACPLRKPRCLQCHSGCKNTCFQEPQLEKSVQALKRCCWRSSLYIYHRSLS